MKKNKKNISRIDRLLEIPQEIYSNVPKITITGFNEMIIENFKGILEYEDYYIRINTSLGIINVNGYELRLENMTNDDIKVTGKIEPLHHQDYDGKRVYIQLTDNNKYSISSKLDIGVHKYFDMEQDEYYFDFNIIDESVSLLINSKEQIIVEKLKSLLKFGITSTRFKDIFDFYYLINNEKLDKDKLIKYIDILIFQDENMRENTLEDVNRRLTNILNNRRFQSRINTANNNWLEIPIKDVIDNVLEYFDGLIKVKN